MRTTVLDRNCFCRIGAPTTTITARPCLPPNAHHLSKSPLLALSCSLPRKAPISHRKSIRSICYEMAYDISIDDGEDVDDDDETASTMTDDSSSVSSSEDAVSPSFTTTSSTTPGLRTAVSFDARLVTAVYLRPRTTMQEQRDLYYTEYDYREFRREYVFHKQKEIANNRNGKQPPQKQKPRVQFCPSVVTTIHEGPFLASDPTLLYYSESELQG